MDLYTYYYKMKREKGTTMGELSEYFVINRTTLSLLIHNRAAPSYAMCKKIERLTNGQVKAWEMIKSFSDEEDMRERKKIKIPKHKYTKKPKEGEKKDVATEEKIEETPEPLCGIQLNLPTL